MSIDPSIVYELRQKLDDTIEDCNRLVKENERLEEEKYDLENRVQHLADQVATLQRKVRSLEAEIRAYDDMAAATRVRLWAPGKAEDE